MRAARLRLVMNLWPPFLCNGIHVATLTEDWSYARVVLRRRLWNRNYVGTQFGGNLFAMTDPFWMLLVMHRLGARYYVWDKAAEIDFIAPGRSDVAAEFRLDPRALEEIQSAAESGDKVLRWFETTIKAPDGEIVARVRKELYVPLKPAER